MSQIEVKPAEIKQPKARDWLIRFAFGAGVSVLAGVGAALFGPRVGGVFLAFPAILLASLTLIAEEDGLRQARDDARGAAAGTAGLLVFALVVACVRLVNDRLRNESRVRRDLLIGAGGVRLVPGVPYLGA
jgi:uncharacterized protein DUF3147